MPKSRRYILFLHHKYTKQETVYYQKLLKGATTIAVDGGISFFLKNKTKPDILIGDFDSAPKLSSKYLQDIEVITHPLEKDKTDTQLALELALDREAEDIKICGVTGTTEIDHTLGNILLLDQVCRYNRKYNLNITARMICPDWEAQIIKDQTIELKSKKNDTLSIIPLSENCRIDYSGLYYPCPNKKLQFGDTLTLRNRFTERTAKVTVKGRALVAVVFNK